MTDSSKSADHSVTQTVTINLIGINDNSPEFSPVIYYTTIQENTAEGKNKVKLIVGTIRATSKMVQDF